MKSAINSIVSFLALLLAISVPVTADDFDYEVITPALPNEARQLDILRAFEESTGHTWLTTYNGLFRISSNAVSHYNVGNSGNQHIVKVFETIGRDIFAVSRNGHIYRLNKNSNDFSRFIAFDPASVNAHFVADVEIGQNREVCLLIENGHIYCTSLERTGWKKIIATDLHEITDITSDKFGNLYAVDRQAKLFSLDLKNSTLQAITNLSSCTGSELASTRIQTHDNSIFWLSTNPHALFRYNRKNDSCKQVHLTSSKRTSIRSYEVHISDDGESVLVATDFGLFLLSGQGEILNSYHASSSDLKDDYVISMAQSHDPNVFWIGTYQGLNMLVRSVNKHYSSQSDPRLNSIVNITDKSPEGILIASLDNILEFNELTGSHTDLWEGRHIPHFKSNQISLVKMTDHGVWIGYFSNGLEHYSAEGELLEVFKEPVLSSGGVSGVLPLSPEEVLVGTYGGGVSLIELAPKLNSRKLPLDLSRSSDFVVQLFQDRNKNVWIATQGGLHRYNIDTKVATQISSIDSSTNDNITPLAVSITQTPDGSLWFATLYNGLLRLLPEDYYRTPTPLQTVQLNSTKARTLVTGVEYSNGFVWVASGSEIFRLDSKTGYQPSKLIYRNGNVSYDSGASHVDNQGYVYFGSSNGYTKIDPSHRGSTQTPKILLDNINVGGNTVHAGSSPSLKYTLELQADDHFVTFTFSVLDYTYPDKSQYRYRLEGFDPNWVDSGNRNSATYTNLPPGHYTLHVQGADSYGNWNREGIKLQLTVLPSFWQTRLAYALYATLFLLVLWWAKKTHEAYVAKRQANALALDMQRTADNAMDQLQDQLDFQGELLRSTEKHYNHSLDYIENWMSHHQRSMEVNPSPTATLRTLNTCLHFRGEELLIDMEAFVNRIIDFAISRSEFSTDEVTIICHVDLDMLDVKIAAPVALVIQELLHQALSICFVNNTAGHFIQLALQYQHEMAKSHIVLEYSHSGGHPEAKALVREYEASVEAIRELILPLGGTMDIQFEADFNIHIMLSDAK